MDIKTKPLYARLLILFAGLLVLNILAAGLEILLREYLGIEVFGAIPKLILYILPSMLLAYWLGIFQTKKSDHIDNPPSDDKWTN